MIDGSLRKLFRANVPGDWVSIESGLTDQGIPDSQCCINGVEFWLEYKRIVSGWSIPKSKSWPSQIGWHLRRARHGGRTFIAVRRAQDELWLFAGKHIKLLAVGGLRGGAPPLGVWKGGPARWPWAEVARILIR